MAFVEAKEGTCLARFAKEELRGCCFRGIANRDVDRSGSDQINQSYSLRLRVLNQSGSHDAKRANRVFREELRIVGTRRREHANRPISDQG